MNFADSHVRGVRHGGTIGPATTRSNLHRWLGALLSVLLILFLPTLFVGLLDVFLIEPAYGPLAENGLAFDLVTFVVLLAVVLVVNFRNLDALAGVLYGRSPKSIPMDLLLFVMASTPVIALVLFLDLDGAPVSQGTPSEIIRSHFASFGQLMINQAMWLAMFPAGIFVALRTVVPTFAALIGALGLGFALEFIPLNYELALTAIACVALAYEVGAISIFLGSIVIVAVVHPLCSWLIA